jgi:hypothetical protein
VICMLGECVLVLILLTMVLCTVMSTARIAWACSLSCGAGLYVVVSQVE